MPLPNIRWTFMAIPLSWYVISSPGRDFSAINKSKTPRHNPSILAHRKTLQFFHYRRRYSFLSAVSNPPLASLSRNKMKSALIGANPWPKKCYTRKSTTQSHGLGDDIPFFPRSAIHLYRFPIKKQNEIRVNRCESVAKKSVTPANQQPNPTG